MMEQSKQGNKLINIFKPLSNEKYIISCGIFNHGVMNVGLGLRSETEVILAATPTGDPDQTLSVNIAHKNTCIYVTLF